MRYIDQAAFGYVCSIPAVLTYVLSVTFLVGYLPMKFANEFTPKEKNVSLIKAAGICVLFVFSSIISGVLDGFVWWLVSGAKALTIFSALKIGAAIGFLVALIFMGG
ncbi:hypothetical protein ONV78_24695 [Hahella sp. CR1]|uniref:hypothetical protein n=1 Tax=Hahella sp. CR1 TaxID=2992807 RepID=UPI00244372AA|nr:hypothetical protein [Hahella sp. CR1]MDG9670962.1 hypothetical protein [Hahella sp. CR1]